MEIKYHPLVVKVDIPKLDKTIRERVKTAIFAKLTTRQDLYGVPLRHNLRNLRKVRAGDYRIVFAPGKEAIFIIAIAHRKDIYKIAERRI